MRSFCVGPVKTVSGYNQYPQVIWQFPQAIWQFPQVIWQIPQVYTKGVDRNELATSEMETLKGIEW